MIKRFSLLASATLLGTTPGCVSMAKTQAMTNELVIDFATMSVSTHSWAAKLVDCSDDKVMCIEVPERFLMSFPRQCPVDEEWNGGRHRVRMTAPAPHLGSPSGGYISDKYPSIHMIYRSAKGFVSLSRTKGTPYEADWSPSNVFEDYRIRYVAQDDWFICDQAKPSKS